MKKTCALFVIGLILAMIGYYFAIRRFIPEAPLPAALGLALLGAFSALALVGAITRVVQGVSDRSVIQRAVKNKPFADGKQAAAIGSIAATGMATLSAPFSGRECVAYEYEVYELTDPPDRHSAPIKKLHCSGFGMAPSAVRTMTGNVRLLGFPLLDEWPRDFIEDAAQRSQANAYLSQTKFVSMKKNLGNVFSEFDDLFRDADGDVRKDIGDPVQIAERHLLTEVIVPAGVQVGAFGVFSQKDNALVAKTSAFPIRLIPGNAEETEKRLQKASFSQIVFSLVFFLFVNGILGFIGYTGEKHRYQIPESQQFSVIQKAAEAGDFDQLTKLFQNGVNPDATDSQSRSLLQTTDDDEVARFLLKFHANPNREDPATQETPLFDSSRTGDLNRMKILIDGGANVNAVCPIPWRHTPIDEALRNGRSDAVEQLLKAGAKDPRVTSTNGQPISESGEEIALCRAYLRAIHSQDKETLKKITTPRYEYFFDDVDFDVWKKSYPVTIETFEGYSNETAATISFQGTRTDGSKTVWVYQLEKQPDGWKIHQTWPLEGSDPKLIWR